MYHPFDQLAKNLLRDALTRACTAETEVEVLAATQKIDVFSVPDPAAAVWGLALCVVVLVELPRTRETLLLRLLGKGRLFSQALADLARLPDDAWERSVATPLLVHFRLDRHEHPTHEEDTVSAEIRAWFEDYERKVRSEERAATRQGSAACCCDCWAPGSASCRRRPSPASKRPTSRTSSGGAIASSMPRPSPRSSTAKP
ncbi:MAG TPA: hypothetical protein VNO30_06810 [Kofleriaceae bacterium]|nr:hypothetical protein [Kofleriaceae bacterium]